MRTFFAATLAVGLFGTLGYAQDAKEGAAAPPVPFADADKSTEAIEKGFGMLETAAKAYRTAPAITESIKIKVETPMGPQNQGMASEWGPNGTFRISMEDDAMEIVSDGSIPSWTRLSTHSRDSLWASAICSRVIHSSIAPLFLCATSFPCVAESVNHM